MIRLNVDIIKGMVDLQKAINRQTKVIGSMTNEWVLYEHRCPKCNRAIVDYNEYLFAESTGMCGSCDHILSDGATSERLYNDIS